ncbi:MAG: hypothetical protein Q7S64_03385 [bacterium]|nr:hypothetical protein [bacterium]
MDQSELHPRFAIIASTQKLTDRFLYTGSLPNEGNSPLSLLYSLEVTRAWFPSSKLISTITAVLSERFGTIQRSANPLKSFEAAIKHINEELYALAEQGETEWIGHLNALLALVNNNEVHLSQTGTSTAYLFRQRRISQVTEADAAEAEPHPLNTFSNIISGQLVEGDRIVLSNQDLFALVSLDHIRAAVTDQSPYVAANQISRSVKRTKVTSVSSIIIAIEKASIWQEAGDEPLVINLEESLQSWPKAAWKKLKPVAIKVGELSKKAWHTSKTGLAKAHQKWREHYGPKTKELWQKSSAVVSKQVSKIVKIKQPVATDDKLGHWLAPYIKKLEPVQRVLEKADHQIGQSFTKVRPLLTGRNSRYIIITLALIFLISSGVSIRKRHNVQLINTNRSANDTILSEVQELAGKTDVAIQLDQKVEAERLIVEAQKKLATIANPNESQQQQYDSLLKIVQEKGDKLTNTRRISVATNYKAPANTNIIVATDKGLFALNTDSNTGRYLARDLSQSELEFTLEQGADKPVSASYDREKDEVFILTTSKRIYGVRLENNAIKVRRLENPLGDFADGNFIGTFGENLYLVNAKDGLLWKYPPSGDNYAKGVNQVDPAHVSLQGVTAVAIDGYIYTLHPNGTVDKLLRGEKATDFAVKDLPASNHTSNFTDLVTGADTDTLYLFDRDNEKTFSSRVVMLGKDGKYNGQLAFSEQLKDVKDFSLDEVNKRFWILTGNTILEYKY